MTASLEDYLEAIYQIIAAKQGVRPRDIARRLSVSNASVTGALRALAGKKLINYAPYDVISLTPAGRRAAREVVRRHEVLRDFLIKVLEVNEAEADEAACQMEHSITKPVLERLVKFVEYIDGCPRGGARWIEDSGFICVTASADESCERCITLEPEDS